MPRFTAPRLLRPSVVALLLFSTGCRESAPAPSSPPASPLLSADGKIRASFALEPEGWIHEPARMGAKVTVLDFWATWCEPCLKEFPEWIELQKTYGPQGLSMIGVASNEPTESAETIRPYLEKYLQEKFPGLNYPVAYDSSTRTIERFKVEGLPFVMVLSSAGEVVFSGRGPDAREAIFKLLGVPDPKPKTPKDTPAPDAPPAASASTAAEPTATTPPPGLAEPPSPMPK